MPLPRLRAELRQLRCPNIVVFAARFHVSKEAMARAYVDYHRGSVAIIIIIRDIKVLRI